MSAANGAHPGDAAAQIPGVAIVDEFPRYVVIADGRIIRRGKSTKRRARGRLNHAGYRIFIMRDRDSKPRSVRAGRLVCRAFHGEPPTPEHEAAHQDHDRQNDSAANLRWRTHAENEAEKARAGRAAKMLTATDVKAIRAVAELREQTRDEIAAAFGVSKKTICLIVTRKRWAHVR